MYLLLLFLRCSRWNLVIFIRYLFNVFIYKKDVVKIKKNVTKRKKRDKNKKRNNVFYIYGFDVCLHVFVKQRKQ